MPDEPTSTPPARTFSQEDVDRIVSDRLARDRASRTPQISDDELARLRALEASTQTEHQRIERERDEARRLAALTAIERDRLRVANEVGLTGDRLVLADRLRGENVDQMRQDAQALLALFPSPPAGSPAAPDPAAPAAPAPAAPAAPQPAAATPAPAPPAPSVPSPGGAGQPVAPDDQAVADAYMAQHFPQFVGKA